ncbi:ATP-binding protein [Myxococcota bacterium]|nr:ATP-binding protein [Myxococcota bacterium]
MPFRKRAPTLTGRLRWDIIIIFCVLLVVGAIGTLEFVARNVSATLHQYIEERGALLADVLADQLEDPLKRGDHETVHFLVTTESEHCAYLLLTTPGGHRFAAAGHESPAPPALLAIAPTQAPIPVTFEGEPMLDVSAALPEGQGVVRVGVSLAPVTSARQSVVIAVLESTAVVLVLGLSFVFWLAGLITRPLSLLGDAATRLSRGETSVTAPLGGHAELQTLAETFNDMATQIRLRMAQSEAMRRLTHETLEGLPVAVLVCAPDGEVRFANDRARPLTAFALDALFPGGHPVHPRPRALQSPEGRHFDVTTAEVEVDGAPGVLVALADVTEVHQLSARLHRVERLAVAGEVSAGIVHAINNPLDGMRRALDLARRQPENAERVAHMLELATEGADRIGQITRTLLDFARADDRPVRRAVPAADLISEAVALVSLRAEARRIVIERRVDPESPLAFVDPRSFTEVLVNLLVNALDAVPSGEGRIEITARASTTGGVTGALEFGVSDNGPGMSPDVAAQVFEPFFTTKAVGRGTGLGLSVARRIVGAHGGELTVESASGTGSRFIVKLPPQPDEPNGTEV